MISRDDIEAFEDMQDAMRSWEYWSEETLDQDYADNWFTDSMDHYQDFVESMMLTAGDKRLVENTFGLVGEAGEVAEKVKKYYRDGVLNAEDVAKELGDVLFYVAGLAGHLGYDLSTIAAMNMEKLQSRKDRGKLQGSGDER
jgi:NTP pyrophosphatase (non-canonical NTP hydrolase)